MKITGPRLKHLLAVALLSSCAPNAVPPPAPPPSAIPGSQQSIEVDEDALWRANDGYQEEYSDTGALAVLEQVEIAVWAMADGESEKARELLRSSAADVAAIRRRNSDIDLCPISVSAELVNTAPQGLAEIHALRGQALQAMKSGDLPFAREQLSNLVSEVRVTTTKASLRGWASTIERAEALLDEGKIDDTCDALADGFGAVQEHYGVKPVPVALAEHELKLAKESTNAAEFRARLESARFQLSRAEALGYTGEGSGYREVKDALRAAGRAPHPRPTRPQPRAPSPRPQNSPPAAPSIERGLPAPGKPLWTGITQSHEPEP